MGVRSQSLYIIFFKWFSIGTLCCAFPSLHIQLLVTVMLRSLMYEHVRKRLFTQSKRVNVTQCNLGAHRDLTRR
jgi:hypothetical protein